MDGKILLEIDSKRLMVRRVVSRKKYTIDLTDHLDASALLPALLRQLPVPTLVAMLAQLVAEKAETV